MDDITYRSLRPQDADALHGLVSDWDVVRQLGSWPWPPQRAFTQSRCKTYAGNGFVWGIFAKDLIGTVAITEGELGYSLVRAQWGKGIVTYIAGVAIDHGFRDPARQSITASIWSDNAGSRKVLTKLGFLMDRVGTEHALARDAPTETIYYSLTRAAWHRLRTGAQ